MSDKKFTWEQLRTAIWEELKVNEFVGEDNNRAHTIIGIVSAAVGRIGWIKAEELDLNQQNKLTKMVRKECHTRTAFAYAQAERFLKSVNVAQRGGNILTCKAMHKFLQARRIYIHYQNEYQLCQNLPFSI